jgi:hypothetical protein
MKTTMAKEIAVYANDFCGLRQLGQTVGRFADCIGQETDPKKGGHNGPPYQDSGVPTKWIPQGFQTWKRRNY